MNVITKELMDVVKQGAAYKAKVVWFYKVKITLTVLRQRCNKRNPDALLRKQKLLVPHVGKHLIHNARHTYTM